MTDEELDNYFNSTEDEGGQAPAPAPSDNPNINNTIERYGGDINKLAEGYLQLQSHASKKETELRSQIPVSQAPAGPPQPDIKDDPHYRQMADVFKDVENPADVFNPDSEHFGKFVQVVNQQAEAIAEAKVGVLNEQIAFKEQKASLMERFPGADAHLDEFTQDMNNPNMGLPDLYQMWGVSKGYVQLPGQQVQNQVPANQPQQVQQQVQQPQPQAQPRAMPAFGPVLNQEPHANPKVPPFAQIPGSAQQQDPNALTAEEIELKGHFDDIGY